MLVARFIAPVVALLATGLGTTAAVAETARVKQAVAMHERPGDSYRVVGKLAAGTQIDVARRKDDWAKVGGARGGWIPASALGPAGAAAPAPRAAATRKKAAPARRAVVARGKARGKGRPGKPASKAEADAAVAQMEWGGGGAKKGSAKGEDPFEDKSAPQPRARTEPPPEETPPTAGEEIPPALPPKNRAAPVAEEAPARAAAPVAAEEEPEGRARRSAQAADEPAADDERGRLPRGRRIAAAADEDEPRLVKKKGKKKHNKGRKADEEEDVAVADDEDDEGGGDRHPFSHHGRTGISYQLFAMGGYSSWRESVSSAKVDNLTVPLSSYDLRTGAAGAFVGGLLGYNAGGFLFAGDASYRYFGANPGIHVSTMDGSGAADLAVLSHGVDVGGRLGFRSDHVSVFGRAGWSSTLIVVGKSDLAPLPNDKVKGLVVGGGLDITASRASVRLRGEIFVSPQREQDADLVDGDAQATKASQGSLLVSIRLGQYLGLVLGSHIRYVDSQFSGVSQRLKMAATPVDDTHRSTLVVMATGGLGVLY